jgi:tRNA nucleotidyltransferase (CCA-adding enzyme)
VNDDVRRIAEAVRTAGGRALLVGGFVRDRLLGLEPKDADLEVYGLEIDALERTLAPFGEVKHVGKSFGVLKVLHLDVSVPRRDSKTGAGHRGFTIEADPSLSYEEATRRRDFTINAMMLDPLTDEIVDPHGGRRDLDARVLRAVDARTFVEDPLRVLRAAQFLARFDLEPAPELVELCASIAGTLRELPAERLWEEWVKLLLKGRTPSRGLRFMRAARVDETLFPELAALAGCQQEPDWHPEGDVFVHTCMALDVAAAMRTGDPAHDLPLMLGVLCHDFGKPPTTQFIDGRWRSRDHETAGIAPTRAFLERLKASPDLIRPVSALVEFHLAPAHFAHPKFQATPRAYRNLARKLAAAGTSIEMLHKVSTCDHFGRTTADALARQFPAGDTFLAEAKAAQVVVKPPTDVVLGRHLIERGMAPGPKMGEVLDRCRQVQDETGLKDPEEILRIVLKERGG